MADLTRTVAIIFEGDDRVSRALNSVSKGFNQFDQTVTAIAQPLARVADTVIAVDAALSAMVVGGLALAIRESGKFGDSFAEISTLTEVTGEDIDLFRKEILKYAQDSRKSIDDINAAIYTAISGGVDYKNALDILNQSEKLSIAGRADLEATTRLLVSTLNAYGETTKEANRYSDIFFQTVKLGQTTIPELADSVADLTGIAGPAGIKIEEIAAALVALTATGAPTTKAVTQVRGILNALIKPSEQAKDLAAQLGIEFNLESVRANGLQNVLWKVYEATGGNEIQMGKLFGRVEGLTGALVLGSDVSGKYANALKGMENAAGSTEEAYRKMADEFTNINQRLVNNVEVTLINLGDRIQKAYVDAATGMTHIFQVINEAIDAGVFDELFDLFNNFGGNLRNLLEEIAQSLPEALEGLDFSGLVDALRDFGDEIGDLFADFDPSDPEDLKRVLQALIDTLESLIRVTQGMIQYFEPLWAALRKSISEFNAMDEQAKLSFGKVLGAAELVVHAGTLIAAALIAIKESGADITHVFDVVSGIIKTVWNTITTAFQSVALMIQDALILWATGIETITNLIPGLEGVNLKVTDIKESLIATRADILASQMEDVQDAVDGVHKIWKGITGETEQAKLEVVDYKKKVDELPKEKITMIEPIIDETKVINAKDMIATEIPSRKDTIIMTQIDGTQKEIALGQISVISSPRSVPIKPEVDPDSMKKAELEYNLLIARLQEKTKILQAAYEYKAKVDIAEIEAGTERMKAAFESVNVGIKDTGDLIGSLFGQLTKEGLSFQQAWAIEDQIRHENRRRDEMLKLQREITEAQIDLMEARKEALERGDAIIKIESDGLEPYLEAFMWAILEKIQIRANQEQEEFLLGIA